MARAIRGASLLCALSVSLWVLAAAPFFSEAHATHAPQPAPVAYAGWDQTVYTGAAVTLYGSGSTGTDLSYMWTQTSGANVTLSDPAAEEPTFTAPSVPPETLVFRLTITDGDGRTSDDTVTISVPYHGPTARAGDNRTVQPGSEVTLDGSASTHPRGFDLIYSWSQLTDKTVNLRNADWSTPSFTAPKDEGDLVFELGVIEYGEVVSTDNVTITVEFQSQQATNLENHQTVASGPRDIAGLILENTGPGTILATWDVPSDEPVDYRIMWAKSGEPFKTWTDLTGNAFPAEPSHAITGLEEGEYNVKVRARYGGTAGDWSGQATVSVTESAPEPPAAPQNLVATAARTSITLDWEQPAADGVTGYKILSRTPQTQDTLSVLVADTNSTDTSHVVDGLDPGTIYVFRVIALGDGSESGRSNFVRLSTLP